MAKTPEWTDELLTGDLEIDAAHRLLFKRALDFAGACERGQGVQHLDGMLAFFIDHGARHFVCEEEKMAAIDYPYMATHIAAHRSFQNRLEELRELAAQPGNEQRAARACAELALDWFARHVRLVDRPFIELLRGDRR